MSPFPLTRVGGAVPVQRPDQPLDLFWTKPLYNNFDNIGTSILTLVEIVTLEGWLDVMYNGVDAHLLQERGNLHPTRDNNPAMCLFFLLFIVVGSFFIWNLFVGVTIDKFNEMKEKQEGRSIFLTEEQRIWVSVQVLPRPPGILVSFDRGGIEPIP